jgi:hypothetical protein
MVEYIPYIYQSSYNRGNKNYKQRVVMRVFNKLRRVRKEPVLLSDVWAAVNEFFEAKEIQYEIQRQERIIEAKRRNMNASSYYMGVKPGTYTGD